METVKPAHNKLTLAFVLLLTFIFLVNVHLVASETQLSQTDKEAIRSKLEIIS